MTISKTLNFAIKVFYHLKQNLIVEGQIEKVQKFA